MQHQVVAICRNHSITTLVKLVLSSLATANLIDLTILLVSVTNPVLYRALPMTDRDSSRHLGEQGGQRLNFRHRLIDGNSALAEDDCLVTERANALQVM